MEYVESAQISVLHVRACWRGYLNASHYTLLIPVSLKLGRVIVTSRSEILPAFENM